MVSLLLLARAVGEAYFVAALPSVGCECRRIALRLRLCCGIGLLLDRVQCVGTCAQFVVFRPPKVTAAQAPRCLQRLYTVIISVLVALLIVELLAEWTSWLLLALLVPMRPVRVLVDTAQKRDEREIPGLVYCEFFSMAFW